MYMIKKVKIPVNTIIHFKILDNTKYLFMQTKMKNYFLLIPHEIDCIKENNLLIFKCNKKYFLFNNFLFNNFLFNVQKYFKTIDKPFKKKLILKGLGLKANFSSDLKNLELKLGLSHVYCIPIPLENISVSLNKNIITLEGMDEVYVGNFSYKIKKLKFPNIYKGKGIWYKNEVKPLKTIKKT